MQVSWETLEAVAATKAIDVWMLYPTGMGLNRLLKKNGKIPLKWEQTLNRSLGCRDWQDAFYQEIQTLDLFGDTTTTLVKQANTAKFEGFLIERWRTIFAGVAPETLPLRNSKGQVMYLLGFACGNPRGVVLAMQIARSVDQEAAALMSGASHIEWTEATWNPIAGCTILSPGCHKLLRTTPRLPPSGYGVAEVSRDYPKVRTTARLDGPSECR